MEAMRCLTRRLSDIVYRHMVDDAMPAMMGPGGHWELLLRIWRHAYPTARASARRCAAGALR